MSASGYSGHGIDGSHYGGELCSTVTAHPSAVIYMMCARQTATVVVMDHSSVLVVLSKGQRRV